MLSEGVEAVFSLKQGQEITFILHEILPNEREYVHMTLSW